MKASSVSAQYGQSTAPPTRPCHSSTIEQTFAGGDAGAGGDACADAKSTFRNNRVVCDVCDNDTPKTCKAPTSAKTIPNNHWRRHDPNLWQSVPSIPADAKVHHKDWFQKEYGGAHAETKKTQNQERVDSYFTDVQTRSKVYGDYNFNEDGKHSETGGGSCTNAHQSGGRRTRYENTDNWKYREECKRAQDKLDTQRKTAIKQSTKLPELSETRATNQLTQGTIQDLWPDTKYPNRYSAEALRTLRKLGFKDKLTPAKTTVETTADAKKNVVLKKKKLSDATSHTSLRGERHGIHGDHGDPSNHGNHGNHGNNQRRGSNVSHKSHVTPTIHDSGSYHSADEDDRIKSAERRKKSVFARRKTMRRGGLADIKQFQQQYYDSKLGTRESEEHKNNVRFRHSSTASSNFHGTGTTGTTGTTRTGGDGWENPHEVLRRLGMS